MERIGQTAPSMPGTVRDTEVPHYFREPYVYTGYRPLNQSWRYYFLSLFQLHNETINIWTHLLPFLVLLVKSLQLAKTVDFVGDPHSWPLLVLVLSSLTYTGLSTAAHLLGGKSEMCHYTFYFLDYVGIAQYQYGSGVVHFYYVVGESLHRHVHGVFVPLAAGLSCLSCLGCCYGQYYNHNQPSLMCKLGKFAPSALTFLWDSTPVAERLMSWSTSGDDPVLLYLSGQVVLMFSAAFFFNFPLLERSFPGRCDFIGQSHQLFHVFVSSVTLSQFHTAPLDFVGRRKVYSRLHGSGDAALVVRLYVVTLVVCALIVAFMLRKVKQVLDLKKQVQVNKLA